MNPPFTAGQFLDVMVRYNEGVWPMQVVFYLVAAALVLLPFRPSRGSDRWIAGLLVLLWAWMGAVYHWAYFTAINPAAWIFGGAFLLQAAVFWIDGVHRDRLAFRFAPDARGLTGAAFMAYALVAYPLLGALAGHAYPAGPTFGLPCPTAIVTFGLLLWTRSRVPVRVLVIPAAWSVLGFAAVLRFGIIEDVGLLVAGMVGTALVLGRNRRLAVASSSGIAMPA